MARGEYLLEVRAEEIPARMLRPATAELSTRLVDELRGRGLGPREVEASFTPRRLYLALSGLPAREPDRDEEVVGPPVAAAYRPDGQPTPAAEGFAKRCGVTVADLGRRTTEKGEYLLAVRHLPGRPTAEVLGEIVPRLVSGLSWAKTMRWGGGEGPWVRPVHGVLSLLDGEVVPIALFGVAAGAETTGHAVLSPRPFRVRGRADYLAKLARRGVVVRFDERRRRLLSAMEARAREIGGVLVVDDELLDKLAAICEIPGVMEGRFDARYLDLPREVLTSSLRDHQSALTVEQGSALLPIFLTVMDRGDDPVGRVRAGNEWVVAARLADAEFFYRRDRELPLAARGEKLAHLAFHERLGSYAAKAERLAGLATTIGAALGAEPEIPAANEAARLLKADLTCDLVREFTSLQGVMGGIYAAEQGHAAAVAEAIYDQYLPATVEDAIPRGLVGRIVGLADRLDTLVGIFGLGLLPSGSRDPFGLRRAAQGIVRILLDGGLELDVQALLPRALELYGDSLPKGAAAQMPALVGFLEERVRYLLGLAGFAYDEIEAGLRAGWQSLPELRQRVAAVHAVRDRPGFLDVVRAAKRIANITKDQPVAELAVDRLAAGAEAALFAAGEQLRAGLEADLATRDFERSLARVAELAPVLERFFVEVLVMDPDAELRANRIALLGGIARQISRLAELTEVVVERT